MRVTAPHYNHLYTKKFLSIFMAKKGSLEYYNSFVYRVEKKISVEDYPKMKDYAKNGIYLYIIHDIKDNNRFLFLSSTYYEEQTKINPEQFNLVNISSTQESIHLKIKYSEFNIPYFELMKEKSDFSIVFSEILNAQQQKVKLFIQYKTHTKKIAIDNPDWYLKYLDLKDCQSFKKKSLKMLLVGNSYSPQIINHAISTFFRLNNPNYQKFNCHSFILDEGKTGKSSLVGYMGEKVDNVSVAGLYGSSDGLRGKFKGGLVTTTDKTILIDEVNELVENAKHDKVLSVLNSMLENGCYNYQKQFSQKIYSASQFIFMGNISEKFIFSQFLNGVFGNVETLGRRIGIVTYNNSLGGFVKGGIRFAKVPPYLNAISIYLSNWYNQILTNKKFIKKLYKHNEYTRLSKDYEKKLGVMCKEIECPITKGFIKSHSKSIDRVVGRSLKLWIWEHLDGLIKGSKTYNNHTIYEILKITSSQLDLNIINFENIISHVQQFKIEDKKDEFNRSDYKQLNKTEQALLKIFYDNKDIIGVRGVPYPKLSNRGYLKHSRINYIKRGSIPIKITSLLQKYGVTIQVIKNEVVFKMINSRVFEDRISGLFEVKKIDTSKYQTPDSEKIEKAYNNKDDDDLDLDDLN